MEMSERGRVGMGNEDNAMIWLNLEPNILHLIYKIGAKFLTQLNVRVRKRCSGTTNNRKNILKLYFRIALF